MAYKPRSATGSATAASTGYPAAAGGSQGVYVQEGQAVLVGLQDVGGWTAGYAKVQISTSGDPSGAWYDTGYSLRKDTDGYEHQAVDLRYNYALYVRIRTSSDFAGSAPFEIRTGEREYPVG